MSQVECAGFDIDATNKSIVGIECNCAGAGDINLARASIYARSSCAGLVGDDA